jgi:hypothetical protein
VASACAYEEDQLRRREMRARNALATLRKSPILAPAVAAVASPTSSTPPTAPVLDGDAYAMSDSFMSKRFRSLLGLPAIAKPSPPPVTRPSAARVVLLGDVDAAGSLPSIPSASGADGAGAEQSPSVTGGHLGRVAASPDGAAVDADRVFTTPPRRTNAKDGGSSVGSSVSGHRSKTAVKGSGGSHAEPIALRTPVVVKLGVKGGRLT